MYKKVLRVCFYLLFIVTPLIWLPFNFELFEYNKMIFVYLLTIISTSSWFLLMIDQKKLLIKRTPFDIPILLFLGANILSTIFSIDPHTSIFGYYSRSNGGLLSTISYIFLYYCLVSNFVEEEVLGFLRASIYGAVIVSIWAILEHFGGSLSCLFLTGSFNDSCWVQDVQSRVFATLGQPNWLAAYLEILIFPCIYFAVSASKRSGTLLYALFTILLYLAFTFTYSRGATLGVVVGFIILSLLLFLQKQMAKYLVGIVCLLVLINLLFGSALTDFKLLNKFAGPARESITASIEAPTSGTQLETGGTESGTIRLIVWRGALEIFKHYPILGSGVETFAYSYYQYRPVEHNLVSEWDFLYNKAHNEYLNYLSSTGAVGFTTYITLIGWFLAWSLKQTLRSKIKILKFLLAGYIANLVQNFFGFSVVDTSLLFFLIPALVLVLSDEKLSFLNLNKFKNLTSKPLMNFFVVSAVSLYLLFMVTKLWVADTYYASGSHLLESGNAGRAYSNLVTASSLNSFEPLYKSELGLGAASVAVALNDTESTLSAQLRDLSESETQKVLQEHPKNISFYKTAIRTYYILSALDPKYNEITLQTIDQTIALSPTDPKLTYNKALVLHALDRKDEAIEMLKKTLELKPNYKEAQDTLNEYTK